jgi:hypothetical protein
MIDQRQLESMKYFTYIGRFIIIDARCPHESKSRTSKAKAAFNKKNKIGIKFRKETS